MKKIVFLFLCVFFCINISQAQQTYKKVKVTTKDGVIAKGSKATLSDESISFTMKGVPKTYSLSEVLTVQAREGKAGKWALYSGGGCLGIGILVSVTLGGNYNETSGETYDTGTLLLGSVLWAGIFAGAGALIGSASDHYENVYISPKTTSFLNKFNLNLSSKQLSMNNPTKYNLTLSYKF
jgi:hypothetical protein